MPARDLVRVALVRQRLARHRLDRADPPQLAAEALLGRLDEPVAVVVELGVHRPRVVRLEQADDRLRASWVVRVGARQDAARALAQPRRRDRAADELRRHRPLVVVVDAHVARHERVDVAGDEHHVLDLPAADVLQQLAPLTRVALPGVEADVVAAGVDRRHHHHLVGRSPSRRPCEPARRFLTNFIWRRPRKLRGASRSAHARPDLRVAAGLVGAVLALVEQQQVDRPAEAHPPVDPGAAAALGAVRRHALEERPVGGGLAALASSAARAPARRSARRRRRSCPPPRGRPRSRSSGTARASAQRGVGPVERVLGAVLLERLARTRSGRCALPPRAVVGARSRPRRRCSRRG